MILKVCLPSMPGNWRLPQDYLSAPHQRLFNFWLGLLILIFLIVSLANNLYTKVIIITIIKACGGVCEKCFTWTTVCFSMFLYGKVLPVGIITYFVFLWDLLIINHLIDKKSWHVFFSGTHPPPFFRIIMILFFFFKLKWKFFSFSEPISHYKNI